MIEFVYKNDDTGEVIVFQVEQVLFPDLLDSFVRFAKAIGYTEATINDYLGDEE